MTSNLPQDLELARRLEQVDGFGRVALLLAGAADAASTMQIVAKEGRRVFGAKRSAVFLLENSGATLRCMVAEDLSPGYVNLVCSQFQALPGWALLTAGEQSFTPDLRESTDPVLRDAVRQEGIAGAAVLPLVFLGQTIGILAFYHDVPHEYSPDERRLASAFAAQAALAIGKSRLLDLLGNIKSEWQSAFDGSGNGLALVDDGGLIVRGNRAVADMAGVAVTALPGTDIRECFSNWPADDSDPLWHAVEGQTRASAFLDGHGGKRYVLTATPRTEGGMVVAIDDLTEYIRLETRYSRVIATAHDAIVLAGRDGRLISANPAAAELFGLPQARLTALRLTDLLPEELPDERGNRTPDGRRRYQAIIRRADGVRLVDVSVAPLEEGDEAGLVVVARDVTGERLNTEALRRSERRFRTLFARAPIAIVTTNADGAFVSVNPAAVRMVGLQRGARGSRPSDFLLPGDQAAVDEQLARSFRGETRDFIFQFRRTDGAIRQAAAVSVPVEERHGQAVVLSIVRDITDELELRSRLIHSEKMAAIGALVSGVAHELNNPLAGIAALAQAAMFAPVVDDASYKLLETVHREALRASRIVNGLLMFARLRPLERRDTDLNQLVRDTFEATPALLQHGVVWNTDLDPGLPAVSADPEQVRQVVTNLLTNAAHAMRDQPSRQGKVRTWTTPTVVGFEVLDSGPGIAPDALPRIFEPFFTTKAVGEGTGLGLSIAHGIIRAHGGEIRGASQPGGGARFWFELPRDPTQLTRANDG